VYSGVFFLSALSPHRRSLSSDSIFSASIWIGGYQVNQPYRSLDGFLRYTDFMVELLILARVVEYAEVE
jgi:hypothetical protein